MARQREARSRLFRLAADRGALLAATGTHPWSPWQDQRIIDTEHYHRVERDLQYVAWRNNTFSVHVHVGVRGADRALLVCDRLRPVLPELLALSSNSPFLDGRDSGLHSARTQIFTKSFPRCGIPEPFGSFRAYSDYVDFLVRTRSIVEHTQLWWSVRPHHAYGTVEVRICDAQTSAEGSTALAGLITACVAQAALDLDEGVAARAAAGPAHRGELLAGDPLRPRRQADRPRARRGVPGRGDRRPPARLDRAGARRAGHRPGPAGGERGPAPAPRARGGRVDRAGVRRRGGRDAAHLRGAGGGALSEQGESPQPPIDEEQLREALRQLKVDDVLLQTVVTLINLAGRRLTVPEEKDREQAHKAIEAVRALIPLCPEEEAAPIKDALSQLQMLYVKETDERAKARAKIWTPGDADPSSWIATGSMIGIFGGSGFYRFLDDVEEVAVDTPYGPPSARVRLGEVEGARVAFMPRHGDDHSLPPHRINYRANVWAMRQVGVRRILGPVRLRLPEARAAAPARSWSATSSWTAPPPARTPSTTGPRPPTCRRPSPTAAT